MPLARITILRLLPWVLTLVSSAALSQVNETTTGTKPSDTAMVRVINKWVATVREDTSLLSIRMDTMLPQKYTDELEPVHIDYHYRQASLVRLSISPSPMSIAIPGYSGPSFLDYFLLNDSLVFVHEKYVNYHQIGSCGAVEMDIALYYHHDRQIHTIAPERCYWPDVKEAWLTTLFSMAYSMAKAHQ